MYIFVYCWHIDIENQSTSIFLQDFTSLGHKTLVWGHILYWMLNIQPSGILGSKHELAGHCYFYSYSTIFWTLFEGFEHVVFILIEYTRKSERYAPFTLVPAEGFGGPLAQNLGLQYNDLIVCYPMCLQLYVQKF